MMASIELKLCMGKAILVIKAYIYIYVDIGYILRILYHMYMWTAPPTGIGSVLETF